MKISKGDLKKNSKEKSPPPGHVICPECKGAEEGRQLQTKNRIDTGSCFTCFGAGSISKLKLPSSSIQKAIKDGLDKQFGEYNGDHKKFIKEVVITHVTELHKALSNLIDIKQEYELGIIAYINKISSLVYKHNDIKDPDKMAAFFFELGGASVELNGLLQKYGVI